MHGICSSGEDEKCCLVLTYEYISHLPVTESFTVAGFSVPMLIKETAFCWRMMHISQ